MSSPTPDAPASSSPSLLRRAAVVLLAGFLGLGGWHLYRSAPVNVVVRFEVSPSLRTGETSVRREQLVEMAVTVHDAHSGVELVRSSLNLGAGLASPLSPPVDITLPRGSYRMVVTFETARGVRVIRTRHLDVSQQGEQRINL